MSLASVRQVAPEEWIITGTIAASATANTRTAATIQRKAGETGLAERQCPFREVWHIHDIYYVGTNPSPDVQIILKVDGTDQPITPMASSVNVANLTRLTLPLTLPIPRGSVISADLVNVAAVGTVAITVTFKAKVIRRVLEA